MNCLIVDDEPIAIKVIESHLKEFQDLTLIAKCRSAIKAFEVLEKEQIDIIFLDIEMPKMDGFSFLKTLKNPPMVVVTTAHRDFALEGFDLDVVDYLLKPISLNRMMQAIRKAKRLKIEKDTPLNNLPIVQPEFSSYIFIRSERENIKVELQSILYIESLKNHVKIVTQNDTYITLVSIGKMEDKLPRDIFMRVHRSYLVNLHHIENYANTYVVIQRKSIPLGNLYKERILAFLENKQI